MTATRCRTDCPEWCRVDHGEEAGSEHVSRQLWLETRMDGVTASVGLVAFPDSEATESAQTLVCLRVRQRELADKDSVELTPAEAQRLAALLAEAAARAESGRCQSPAASVAP